MIRSREDKTFDAVLYSGLTLVLLVVLLPLLNVLASSISNPDAVVAGKVWFWPNGLDFTAYKQVLKHDALMRSYRNTVMYTVSGTFINIIMTICAAYPLSRKDFVGRGTFMVLIVFTMYFSGGMIPSFLNIRNLNLLDTFWVMILPGAVSAYNIILMRTFIQSSIPLELYEAAKIDGCTNTRLLMRIVLPLSKPVISVLVLFYAVGHWNSYFNALLYINNQKLYPLQLVLREVLVLNRPLEMQGQTAEDIMLYADMTKRAEMLKYAVIVVANLPVLLIYPMIQKYFVQGVMIGSVKG